MNRTVFLTDLRKLLTFLTEEERDSTIRYYEKLLDDAGPEKEEALLGEFGSPTKAAVTIFREYGKNHSALDPRMPDGDAKAPAPERFVPEKLGFTVSRSIPEEPEAEAVPDEPEAETVPEEPETEPVPDEPEAEIAPDEPEAEAVPEEPEPEPVPEEPEAVPDEPETEPVPDEPETEIAPEEPETEVAPEEPETEIASDEPEAETAPEKTEKTTADIAARIAAGIAEKPLVPEEDTAVQPPKKSEPVFVEVPVPPHRQPPMESPYVDTELREYRLPGWAVALIMAATCWLWIPLVAALGLVVLLCFAALFVLGAAFTAGAGYLAICGIWALGVMTDALLMFGAAAVLLAFGILFLWMSVWAVIRLFGLLGKGVGGAYRGIFCRRGGKEQAE